LDKKIITDTYSRFNIN